MYVQEKTNIYFYLLSKLEGKSRYILFLKTSCFALLNKSHHILALFLLENGGFTFQVPDEHHTHAHPVPHRHGHECQVQHEEIHPGFHHRSSLHSEVDVSKVARRNRISPYPLITVDEAVDIVLKYAEILPVESVTFTGEDLCSTICFSQV